jgi:flagellar hook-basal body complex protein FliE
MPIAPISNLPAIGSLPSAVEPGTSGQFRSVLESAIAKVEHMGSDSAQAIERFLSGEGEDLHTVALEAQRAELAFELFLQTRNKIVQAYQEIMRMPM